MEKELFANTIIEADLGITAFSVMGDCAKYGMVSGCDEFCPVLVAGKCELQDSDCHELWLLTLE